MMCSFPTEAIKNACQNLVRFTTQTPTHRKHRATKTQNTMVSNEDTHQNMAERLIYRLNSSKIVPCTDIIHI